MHWASWEESSIQIALCQTWAKGWRRRARHSLWRRGSHCSCCAVWSHYTFRVINGRVLRNRRLDIVCGWHFFIFCLRQMNGLASSVWPWPLMHRTHFHRSRGRFSAAILRETVRRGYKEMVLLNGPSHQHSPQQDPRVQRLTLLPRLAWTQWGLVGLTDLLRKPWNALWI